MNMAAFLFVHLRDWPLGIRGCDLRLSKQSLEIFRLHKAASVFGKTILAISVLFCYIFPVSFLILAANMARLSAGDKALNGK